MITISKLKYSWSTLTIPCHAVDCQIALSYMDDIAIYFLNEFMTYFETVENAEDTFVLTIDEEGNTDKLNILSSEEGDPVVLSVKETKELIEILKKCIKD